jgi:hypothetical protein
MHYLRRSASTIYRTVFRISCQIWVQFETTDMHIVQGCTNTGRQHFVPCGRDGSVGIATRDGLDGAGIESPRGRERFFAPVQTGPEAHPVSYGYQVFPMCKAAGAWRRPPTPSSGKVTETVELLPLWALGWHLPFNLLVAPTNIDQYRPKIKGRK